MASKSKFLSSASTSKHNGAAPIAAPIEVVYDESTQEELREEQPVSRTEHVTSSKEARSEEARDESNPLDSVSSILARLESVFAVAVGEATSMANDVQTILKEDSCGYGKSVGVGAAPDAGNVRTPTSKVQPRGSPTTLALLVKKLDRQQQKLNKAERKIAKAEKKFDEAEKQVVESRKKIRALSEKFNLPMVLNDIDNDEEFEEKLQDVVVNGADSLSDVGQEILHYAKRLSSTIERTANEAIFPHGVADC